MNINFFLCKSTIVTALYCSIVIAYAYESDWDLDDISVPSDYDYPSSEHSSDEEIDSPNSWALGSYEYDSRLYSESEHDLDGDSPHHNWALDLEDTTWKSIVANFEAKTTSEKIHQRQRNQALIISSMTDDQCNNYKQKSENTEENPEETNTQRTIKPREMKSSKKRKRNGRT